MRNDEKGKKLIAAYPTAAAGKLSYMIVDDVAQSGAFDEVNLDHRPIRGATYRIAFANFSRQAVKSTPGFDFVIHTASPFHYNVQDPVKDFLEPAITGTTNILHAVKNGAPSVKRVVITSSFAAINHGSNQKPPFFDESCWNPVTWEEAAGEPSAAYRGSKKLAEKAAWDFMDNEKPAFDLVTLNPTLVFGPAAPYLLPGEIGSVNTSNLPIVEMVQGKMKDKLKQTGFYTYVDVRDVAQAHVRAMQAPEASGKRFLLMAGYHSNKDLADIIASMGPELRDRLPADLESAKVDIPGPEERYRFNNQRSIDILGISYTSLETSVRDTVESLVRLGALSE